MRILVSIEQTNRRTTLSVPDDLAVEALLPLLLDACGGDGSATWDLLPRGANPIDGRRTLRDAGVWQGAILDLRQTGPGERLPPPLERRTLAGLPEPLARRHRLAVAMGGARGQEPFLQAREAWRATDYVTRLERLVADRPLQGGVVIAVTSLQPGSGRTTVALLLASLLARARAEPPLAVDGDPASRSLSRLLAPAARDRLGMALLPASATPTAAPEPAACTSLLTRLRTEWALAVVDCPAGFGSAWGQAAWAAADQLVLVGDDPDALATLSAAGVPVAVLANRVRRRPPGAAAALPEDAEAAARLRAGELTWDTAPRGWRVAVAELAATLAVRWPT